MYVIPGRLCLLIRVSIVLSIGLRRHLGLQFLDLSFQPAHLQAIAGNHLAQIHLGALPVRHGAHAVAELILCQLRLVAQLVVEHVRDAVINSPDNLCTV